MWSIAKFSKAGRRNSERGLLCQDCIYSAEKDSIQVITLADGSGEDDYARMGAEKSCQVLAQLLLEQYMPLYNMEEKQLRFNVAANIKTELFSTCDRHGIEIEQLQSTILGLAVDHSTGTFMAVHLGDGRIEIGRDGRRQTISFPENGVNKGKTFLTSMGKMGKHVRVVRGDLKDIQEFTLSSDGWTENKGTPGHLCPFVSAGASGAEADREYTDDVSYISLMLQ